MTIIAIRPDWLGAAGARLFLRGLDFGDTAIQRRCHLAMHQHRIMAFDKNGIVAIAFQQGAEFAFLDTGKDSGLAIL